MTLGHRHLAAKQGCVRGFIVLVCLSSLAATAIQWKQQEQEQDQEPIYIYI